MNIEKTVKALEEAIKCGEGIKGEAILKDGIKEAIEDGDNGALLQLMNELIGYYREYSRVEDSFEIADRIVSMCDFMGLKGSLPYATSMLNVANAYRAGGRLEDSLKLYDEVEEIFEKELPKDEMLKASFYNNKALLFQEMERFNEAVAFLNKALEIVNVKGTVLEKATTHTNIANTYLGLSRFEEAYDEASRARDLFEKSEESSIHYASALYALGCAHRHFGRVQDAKDALNKALEVIEKNAGKNEFYYRVSDALKQMDTVAANLGMSLSRSYYTEILEPIIRKELPAYVGRIAVGLVGRGSDCFGFDDELSRDHDWGPDLCIWVTKETYDAIGDKLEKIYEELPKEFKGYSRAVEVSPKKRRGVFVIEDFYKEILGVWPVTAQNFADVADYAMAECVNGEVFTDPEGKFSAIRNKIAGGYPVFLLFRKIAQSATMFSQCGQYNYERAARRGDMVTAKMMLSDALKEAMKLAHYLESKYPPHDKWLYTSTCRLAKGASYKPLIDNEDISGLAKLFSKVMYEAAFISDSDDYLAHHGNELMFKAEASLMNRKALIEAIVKAEFEAFDKVKNEGGRAGCQDDFNSFNIYRTSQYMTWDIPMLLQYYYDFTSQLKMGHNLITEKYGRMMESTAPQEYEKIKDNFAELSDEKKNIIEELVRIQVNFMDEFSMQYPKLAADARSIHTSEDNAYNTSYETYLRGELSTYSDRMLEMYGRYLVMYVKAERNLTRDIMLNTVRMYGYESLEMAEAAK